MTRKQWIYVKRGLSLEPKHRARMGACIWLYLHLLDRADWETGTVHNWTDIGTAETLGMELVTVRDQRRKLTDAGYITCSKTQHAQEIKILQWVNPKQRVDGDVINPRDDLESVNLLTLSSVERDTAPVNKLTLSKVERDTAELTKFNTTTLYSLTIKNIKPVNTIPLETLQAELKTIIDTLYSSNLQVPKHYRDTLASCQVTSYEEETHNLIIYTPGGNADVFNARFSKLLTRQFVAFHPEEFEIKFVDQLEIDFG